MNADNILLEAPRVVIVLVFSSFIKSTSGPTAAIADCRRVGTNNYNFNNYQLGNTCAKSHSSKTLFTKFPDECLTGSK